MFPLIVAASVVLWLMGLMTPLCAAQERASSSPAFTVATIKPSDPNRAADDAQIGFRPNGSFETKSQSLKELIEFGADFGYYDVGQRISGGPKWIATAKFDIDAKCDEETAGAFEKMSMKQQVYSEQNMVQALLADRFKLRTHHETRQLAVYALVQGRSGSKIRPAAKAGETDEGGAEGPPGNWEGNGVTMAELASNLSALPEMGGRIVSDKTGLKGRFDFTLKWTQDPTMGEDPAGPENGVKPDASTPSLLTALQEQLGLKLELAKEPVDVIVIDSAEMPTPN